MPKILLLVAMGGLVLTGCAPARFDKATASFSSSVAGMATAMDASLAGLAREERELQEQRLLSSRAVPALSVACIRDDVTGPNGQRLPACGLVAERSQVPDVGPIWRTEAEAVRILRALAVYAKGLEELTSAESRKEINDAVDAVAVGIGGAVGLAVTPPAGAAVSAAVKLGGFAYAETVDVRRYRQLRHSVEVGQRNLPVITTVLKVGVSGVNRARRGYLLRTGDLLAKEVRPVDREYAASFARASAYAARIEALQRADPVAAVDAMLRAHTALAEALERNEGQTLAVAEAMSEFTSRTTALQSAIAAAKKES